MLSRRQRGTIYQLVQFWAQARAERERMTSAAAFAGCWSAIKARYKVAKYEDIRAAQYDDCITYIQRAYQQLTGASLPISEQSELPLEEGADG